MDRRSPQIGRQRRAQHIYLAKPKNRFCPNRIRVTLQPVHPRDRKPARPVFRYTLLRSGLRAEICRKAAHPPRLKRAHPVHQRPGFPLQQLGRPLAKRAFRQCPQPPHPARRDRRAVIPPRRIQHYHMRRRCQLRKVMRRKAHPFFRIIQPQWRAKPARQEGVSRRFLRPHILIEARQDQTVRRLKTRLQRSPDGQPRMFRRAGLHRQGGGFSVDKISKGFRAHLAQEWPKLGQPLQQVRGARTILPRPWHWSFADGARKISHPLCRFVRHHRFEIGEVRTGFFHDLRKAAHQKDRLVLIFPLERRMRLQFVANINAVGQIMKPLPAARPAQEIKVQLTRIHLPTNTWMLQHSGQNRRLTGICRPACA